MLEGVSGEFDDLEAQNMRDFFIVPGVWVPAPIHRPNRPIY